MSKYLIVAVALAGLSLSGCERSDNKKKNEGAKTDTPALPQSIKNQSPRPKGMQVPPPPDVGKPPATAKKTKSGASFVLLETKPEGNSPGRNDTVELLYTQWKPDGTTQYTTNQRNKPRKISLAGVGDGWGEVLQQMKIGEKARVWLTPVQAYGEQMARAPEEMLTFEAELVSIQPAPPIPEDVAAAPASATTTKSGLAYRELAKGTGKVKPKFYDEVEFHYTAWTTDGKMIDSSTLKNRARKSLLFREMDGWQEALQTMVVGEKKRFWVPEELTKTAKWKPMGTLVYDIELVSITKKNAPPPVPKNVAAAPDNAEKTAKGVSWISLKKGKGKKSPASGDIVKVHYSGWTTDGKLFDSSVVNGEPASIPLGRVIPGWNEALPTMVVGDRKRFWIPEELAYKGRPGPQGTLVFDIELLEIQEKPKPPPVPEDVAAPPADAVKTPEGVFYKVLKPGDGKQKPSATDSVVAHYSGWTTDGKMFDSSVPRGKPSTFSLAGVIKGWTIGLQLMSVGQKNRFWIPAELAYAGKPNRPQGMLVFDVELMGIQGSK